MTDERWLPVPGWDHYSVSSAGRVRSEDREILVVTRWNNLAVRRVSGRLLRPSGGAVVLAESCTGRRWPVRVNTLRREAFGTTR